MLRKKIHAIVILILLIIFLTPNFCQAYEYANLDYYVSYFYNRYSKHFDNFSLKYKSPEYGITDWKTPETPREWMSLASYYKYKSLQGDINAKQALRSAIQNGFLASFKKPAYAQSFEDAESYFLMIRIFEEDNNLINSFEQKKILYQIRSYIEAGIKAQDTENRAIVAAAHWQYIVDYLHKKNILKDNQKRYFDNLIKVKIDRAIENCINDKAWYFENNWKDFSPHYHTVSAFMLMVYGALTQQDKYLAIAKEMYYNIKKISFKNGMTEARLGNRPIGLGAQFYLMQGLLGKYFDDEDYTVYLFYAGGHRFFSDKQHPDRLEYHSTLENSDSQFHDDYAFSDKAELGLTIEKLHNINLNFKYFFTHPIQESKDKYFVIKNTGTSIVFGNKIGILGSYGNWSHIYQYAEHN
ncbi:MAG: hypothetical protein ABIJ91_01455 [Candidatus Kuenenbacteria bacterium]